MARTYNRTIPNVAPEGGVDTVGQEIGQSPDRTIDKIPGRIDRVAEHEYDGEKLAMLAFMAEPITIRIATSTDKNAEQVFELNINGRCELFRRGETKTVARYFVDRLARMKVTTFGQKEILNSEGEKQIIYPPHTAIKYDFSVSRDDNRRGDSWLRAVLAEAG